MNDMDMDDGMQQPMGEPSPRQTYFVDRIEGGIAKVILDDGQEVDVPQEKLGEGVAAGSYIYDDGTLAEGKAEEMQSGIDSAYNRMKEKDPGGDITL